MVQFSFSDTNSFGGRGKFGGKPQATPLPKLSIKELKALAFKFKIEVICGSIFLLGSICLWLFFVNQTGKIKVLAKEIQDLMDKEQPLASYVKNIQEDNALVGGLPTVLSEKRFITYLTSLANKRDIVITKISPPEDRNGGFFLRKTVQLTCSVDVFQNALLFLNDIEQSKYALKVDSWQILNARSSAVNRGGRLDSGNSEQLMDRKSLPLNILMTVSSIEILDNEKK